MAAASVDIINLQAILRLPKPTEHFMSDLHGESDAFTHILGNASGVIKEKVDRVLAGRMSSDAERAEFGNAGSIIPHRSAGSSGNRGRVTWAHGTERRAPADRRVAA